MSIQQKQLAISISQNFLTSRKTIQRILRYSTIEKKDLVVEIGAGKGHLTRALAERCRTLMTWEIDPGLSEKLRREFSANSHVKLFAADFLQARLPEQPYKVFVNIPFSHTSDILRKLTESENPPEEACLIVEKGAAKRFCGKPAPTLKSLQIAPFFKTDICYYFRREDFHPSPRVDVALLRLQRKHWPDLPRELAPVYRQFHIRCFEAGVAGRRGPLTKKQCSTALRRAGLPPIPTDGKILYIQWLCLFRYWNSLHGGKRR